MNWEPLLQGDKVVTWFGCDFIDGGEGEIVGYVRRNGNMVKVVLTKMDDDEWVVSKWGDRSYAFVSEDEALRVGDYLFEHDEFPDGLEICPSRWRVERENGEVRRLILDANDRLIVALKVRDEWRITQIGTQRPRTDDYHFVVANDEGEARRVGEHLAENNRYPDGYEVYTDPTQRS